MLEAGGRSHLSALLTSVARERRPRTERSPRVLHRCDFHSPLPACGSPEGSLAFSPPPEARRRYQYAAAQVCGEAFGGLACRPPEVPANAPLPPQTLESVDYIIQEAKQTPQEADAEDLFLEDNDIDADYVDDEYC